ncbi:hypothetical protein Skr01_18820 [Sphaerisporangium krabiense]|nr:hypothetical protein Skr01_18820 [Sphaerisporangium krabiense]
MATLANVAVTEAACALNGAKTATSRLTTAVSINKGKVRRMIAPMAGRAGRTRPLSGRERAVASTAAYAIVYAQLNSGIRGVEGGALTPPLVASFRKVS